MPRRKADTARVVGTLDVGSRASRSSDELVLATADSTGRCNTLITAQAEGVLQMKYRTLTYYTDGQKAPDVGAMEGSLDAPPDGQAV